MMRRDLTGARRVSGLAVAGEGAEVARVVPQRLRPASTCKLGVQIPKPVHAAAGLVGSLPDVFVGSAPPAASAIWRSAMMPGSRSRSKAAMAGTSRPQGARGREMPRASAVRPFGIDVPSALPRGWGPVLISGAHGGLGGRGGQVDLVDLVDGWTCPGVSGVESIAARLRHPPVWRERRRIRMGPPQIHRTINSESPRSSAPPRDSGARKMQQGSWNNPENPFVPRR